MAEGGSGGGVGGDDVSHSLHVSDSLTGGQACGSRVVGSHQRGEDRDQRHQGQYEDGDLASQRQLPPTLETQPGLGNLVECATVQHQTLLILGLTST